MWVEIPGVSPIRLRRDEPVERAIDDSVGQIVIRAGRARREVQLPPDVSTSLEVDYASVPGLVRRGQVIRVSPEGEEWGSVPRPVWMVLAVGMVAFAASLVGLAIRSQGLILVGVVVAALASLVWMIVYVRVHWRRSERVGK